MKSGTVKFKVEGRQSRRLSKSSCFNGGGPSAEVSAYPFETTDHLYAVKDLVVARENMQLRKMVVSHLDMIGQLREELIAEKTRQVYPIFDEKLRVVRRERRMCLMRQERAPPVLATRYFGRKSKTIPNRALKRRYMGPPKTLPSRLLPPVAEEVEPHLVAPPTDSKEAESSSRTNGAKSSSKTHGAKSSSKTHRAKSSSKTNGAKSSRKTNGAKSSSKSNGAKSSSKSNGAKSSSKSNGAKSSSKTDGEKRTPSNAEVKREEPSTLDMSGSKRGRVNVDHLTTHTEYYLPVTPPPDTPTQPPHIDVPSWKLKPVPSFYQMEGTENINEPVFDRRHQKFELDERRRKRWDLQRLREQRAKNERMRKKRERKDGNPASFFPDPQSVEFIEVTEELPVLAFGHPIPLFQPRDFSLPWTPQQKSSVGNRRRGRPPSKVT